MDRARQLEPLYALTHALSSQVAFQAGDLDAARQVLEVLLRLTGARYVPPYMIALVYAGLGDADEAFAWLERAYAAHDVHLMFLPVDPKWAPYRTDQRFTALVAKCGF